MLELDQHVVQLIPPFPVRRTSECEWSVLLGLFGVVRLIFGFLILLLLTTLCICSILSWTSICISTFLSVSLSNFIVAEIVKGSAHHPILLEILNKTL